MPSPVAAGVVKPGAVSDAMPEGTATTALRPTKLFIGGITRNTTTKQLRDHFSAFGRVLDCVAMRQPDGRPRGFGYVTLDSPQAADRSLVEPQVIDGRVVDLKRAVPEGNMESAPQTRLHTPGSAPNRVKTSPVLSTASPSAPSSGASGPNSSSLPLGLDPSLVMGAAQPSPSDAALAAAAAASVAAAMCWNQHWAAAAAVHSMRSMELLSTSPTQHSATAALLSTQPRQQVDLSIPGTPTGIMTASAPEFVPSAVGNIQQGTSITDKRKQEGEPKRSVLGDITNTGTHVLSLSSSLSLEKSDSPEIRRAQLEIDTDVIFEDDEVILSPPGLEIQLSGKVASEQTTAYPIVLSAMQNTKLPTPLALPGNATPCLSRSPVAPPPGLTQSYDFSSTAATVIPWQPDEEVSPTCGQTAAQSMNIAGSFLSTVPVSPSADVTAPLVGKSLQQEASSPMTVRVPSQMLATDASKEPKKLMVTMGTQTNEDNAENQIPKKIYTI
eukprot:TRINITY_DN868_c1_g1_i7.p1 TRINITY_DN868_c1_g1~~TRINITY_DN868_c1_g1_i7.p1  ORF type:complete len:498 (-),score=86.01 TRINITY_DN868_c1_g1_i7:356-1849(-)